jgi:hypothetical protein
MLVDCGVVSSCLHPEVCVQEPIFLMKRIMLVLQQELSRFSNRTVLWGVENEILVVIYDISGGRIGNASSRV